MGTFTLSLCELSRMVDRVKVRRQRKALQEIVLDIRWSDYRFATILTIRNKSSGRWVSMLHDGSWEISGP